MLKSSIKTEEKHVVCSVLRNCSSSFNQYSNIPFKKQPAVQRKSLMITMKHLSAEESDIFWVCRDKKGDWYYIHTENMIPNDVVFRVCF